MKLDDFLKSKNLSHAAFARPIGISGNAIGHYISGRREPHRDIRLKIEQEYGCIVSITSDGVVIHPRSESDPISTA